MIDIPYACKEKVGSKEKGNRLRLMDTSDRITFPIEG